MKTPVATYLERRAEMGTCSKDGDDRCHQDKWLRDAELRGKIGVDAANRVIDAVDTVRSYR